MTYLESFLLPYFTSLILLSSFTILIILVRCIEELLRIYSTVHLWSIELPWMKILDWFLAFGTKVTFMIFTFQFRSLHLYQKLIFTCKNNIVIISNLTHQIHKSYHCNKYKLFYRCAFHLNSLKLAYLFFP